MVPYAVQPDRVNFAYGIACRQIGDDVLKGGRFITRHWQCAIKKRASPGLKCPHWFISWMRLFAFSHLFILKLPENFFLLSSFQVFCWAFKILSSCHDYQYLSFDTHRPLYLVFTAQASNRRNEITPKQLCVYLINRGVEIGTLASAFNSGRWFSGYFWRIVGIAPLGGKINFEWWYEKY